MPQVYIECSRCKSTDYRVINERTGEVMCSYCRNKWIVRALAQGSSASFTNKDFLDPLKSLSEMVGSVFNENKDLLQSADFEVIDIDDQNIFDKQNEMMKRHDNMMEKHSNMMEKHSNMIEKHRALFENITTSSMSMPNQSSQSTTTKTTTSSDGTKTTTTTTTTRNGVTEVVTKKEKLW